MKKIIPLIVLIGLIISTSASSAKLALSRGTTELSGSVRMPIFIPNGGGPQIGIEIAPAWRYFFSSWFALGFDGAVINSHLLAKKPWAFSVGASGQFYIPIGTAVPYLGAGLSLVWPDKNIGIHVLTPIGLLVALNSHVALDVGIPIKFIFVPEGFVGVSLPVGYLGVRAYF